MGKDRNSGNIEVMISIKDLFAEIVRKAWLLAIGMILFGILLGAFKYKQDSEAAKLVAEPSTKEELSEEEREAVSEYLVLRESLDGQKDYIENSLYMQLDPYRITVTNLQFYIETEDESALTSAVIGLRNYITNGSMAAGIEQQNKDLDAAYVQDVFSVNAMDYNSQNVSKIVNLKFYTPDKKTAQAITEAVNVQVAEFSANLQETIGNHSIKLMYQEQGEFLDKNVQSVQENYIKNFTSNKNNVESAFEALSEEQKLVVEESLGERENEENGVEPEENPTPTTPAKVTISKKFVLLGGIVGIIVMACVIAFFYLINGTIKHPEEIRNGYGLPFFGNLSLDKKNFFEKLAQKLFYKEQMISIEQEKELIITKIQVACEQQNISRFVLAGQLKGERAEQFASELTAAMKKNQVEVIVAEDIVNSSKAIRECGKDAYVVLAETLKTSRYSQLRQEILMCREQQKEIIGYFTLSI